jgi:hypothetical protein
MSANEIRHSPDRVQVFVQARRIVNDPKAGLGMAFFREHAPAFLSAYRSVMQRPLDNPTFPDLELLQDQ